MLQQVHPCFCLSAGSVFQLCAMEARIAQQALVLGTRCGLPYETGAGGRKSVVLFFNDQEGSGS